MALGKFMTMVGAMLGTGKYQISGETTVYTSKAAVDAALFIRKERMETASHGALGQVDAPSWATKIYFLRSSTTHRRIGKDAFVFVE